MPARTCRETDGVLQLPPFITVLRNNSNARLASDPLTTITTSGAHHGLVTPTPMLVPYYTKGRASLVTDPMGALSTRDRFGIAGCERLPVSVDDMTYRMMTIGESASGMGFTDGYAICGSSKKVRMRQVGQAVCPALGENSYRAIVEMLSGEESDPAPWPDQVQAAAA
jgi:DNA (cytosine-5)-methyltransferase 1